MCFLPLLPCRELYNLCQMFPVAACKAMQSVLKDSAHSMEEAIEVKGHAAFPTLDMVRLVSSLTVSPVEPLFIYRISCIFTSSLKMSTLNRFQILFYLDVKKPQKYNVLVVQESPATSSRRQGTLCEVSQARPRAKRRICRLKGPTKFQIIIFHTRLKWSSLLSKKTL